MSDILFPNVNIYDDDLFVIDAWLMEDNWDEAGSNDDIEFGRPLKNLDNYINRDGADFAEPHQVPVPRGEIAGNDECLGEPQPLLEELQPRNGEFHQPVTVDLPNFPSHVPFELASQQRSVFNTQQFQAPMDQLMDQGNFQPPMDQLMAHGNFQGLVNQPMAHGIYQVLMAQPNYDAPLAPATLPRPEAVIIVHKKSGNNCKGRPRALANPRNTYMRDYHLKKKGATILRMLRAINSQEELDRQVDLLSEENIFVSFEDHPVHPVLNFDEDSTEVNVDHLQP